MDTNRVEVAEWRDGSGVYDLYVNGKVFLSGIDVADLWEMRVRAYESIGCTRSDAQGIVDAEDMRDGGRR